MGAHKSIVRNVHAWRRTTKLWQKEKEEETLYIYEFEGTGEQLRRLRGYNPILADETEDEYDGRIWHLAYKEDEEKEQEKKKVKVDNDINTLLT